MIRAVALAAVLFAATASVCVSALVVPRTEMEKGLWGSEGHTRARSQWHTTGRADAHGRIRLTFAVKQTNLPLLEQTLYAVSDPDSPTYGQHLTRDEVDELVRPAPESIAAVEQWLAAHGLHATQSTGNKDFLMVDTTVARAEKLLSTQYHVYEGHTTRAVYDRPTKKLTHRLLRTAGAYSVPVNVAKHLDFVAPTIHFPRLKSTTVKRPANPDDLVNTPPVLRELYGVPNTTRGTQKGNVQAFASFLEQYWSPSDLQEFFGLFFNSSVGQTVANSIGPNDPTNPGTEAELDVQYIMGVGAGVTTWSYYTAGRAPNPENEPFLAWLTLLASESSIPAVFSVSYGEDEKSVGTDYGGRVNTEFQKVGVRGSSIMFAAGDDGAGGNCTASGRFSPDFPSGSPWVTAVGGLIGGTPGATPTGEVTDSISGGGFSDYWPAPSYQTAAVKYYLSNAANLPPAANFNPSGRGYPDVAAQSEMFVVVQDGIPLPGVGGTSCASPTFTGVISLLNDARIAAGKAPLGFLNPLIYKIGPAAADANAFNDVTEGANAGCDGFSPAFPAFTHWDAATGWGSPNYRILKPIVLALP